MKKLDVMEIVVAVGIVIGGLLLGKQISKVINPYIPQAGIPQA